MTEKDKGGLEVVIVTGMSGSGKSTVIKVLEDMGFYCVDNLPATLTPEFLRFFKGPGAAVRRVAFGIDAREKFSLGELPRVIRELRSAGKRLKVLFLDASDEVLVHRYSETRRPHPLAGGGNVVAGIRKERADLAELRAWADRILDTSAYTVHELRAEVRNMFGADSEGGSAMSIFVSSFGYKYGTPADTDLVLDVRFLPNPFFLEDLRPLDGRDPRVKRYVLDCPEAKGFFTRLRDLLDFTLPLYEKEGKHYLSVGLGCTGGRHRSVVIAEQLGELLTKRGFRVRLVHRDIDRDSISGR